MDSCPYHVFDIRNKFDYTCARYEKKVLSRKINEQF